MSLSAQAQTIDFGGGWFTSIREPLSTNSTPTGNVPPGLTGLPNICGPFTVTSQTGQPIISEAVTPEITSLAANLQNDPKRIYDYVHNNIKYVHYFGSKKGAYLTMLEGSGNDFDQCALLVALIRAASTNSGISYGVHLQCGFMQMPYTNANNLDMAHWLGLSWPSANNYLFWNYLKNVFGSRNYPDYESGGNIHIIEYNDGTGNTFLFQRVWVRLTISGTDYYLDPAFKISTQVAGIDVTNAMNLNMATVFSAVESGGATISNLYVKNLNYSNLSGQIQTNTSNLLTYLTNHPNLSSEQVTGGYDIQTTNSQTFPCLNFPPFTGTFVDAFNGGYSASMPILEWDNIPTNYMSFINIQIDNINLTYPFPSLLGRKISLTFTNISGNYQSQISLDDVVQATSTTGSGSGSVPMTNTIIHPTGIWNYSGNSLTPASGNNQNDVIFGTTPRSYQRQAYGYVTVYGFDDVSQLLLHREKRLNSLLQQNLNATNASIVTETLNVLGLSWLNQSYLEENLLGAQKHENIFHHHRAGRVAAEAGYYVDLALDISDHFWRDDLPNSSGDPTVPVTQYALFGKSALEHGVIEQIQTNLSSSTMKMLYLANQSGQKLILSQGSPDYSAVSSLFNAETIRPYVASKNTILSDDLPFGTMLIPSGINTVGTWNGYGFVLINGPGSAFIINGANGAFNGGDAGTQVPISGTAANSFTFGSSPTEVSISPPSLPPAFNADPINVLDGSFNVDADDLTVGQAAPRGFTLSRHYDSNRRNVNAATMADGWIHNYIVNAVTRSDPDAGLGRNTAQEMAAFLTSQRIGYEMFTYNPAQTNKPLSECWSTAALCAEWAVDNLKSNAVNVTLGTSSIQFIKQPDGSFTPPAGITMVLTATNAGYNLQMRHGNLFKFGNGHLTNIVDQYGRSLSVAYNSSNFVSTVTDWTNRSLTFTYGGTPLRLTSVADSTGRSVTYGYSTNSNNQLDLTSVIDVQGFTNTFAYDTNHEVIVTKNNLGQVVSSNNYDGFGHVIRQYSQGLTNQMWQGFWNGVQNTLIDPAGGQQQFLYDSKSRQIGMQDALSNFSESFYDGQDHVIETISPLNESNDFIYDGNNNLVETIDPLGASNVFFYDASFNLIKTLDPLGHTNSFGYNSKFQVVTTTNGAGDAVTNTYDSGTGLLTGRSDAGGTTSYGYDSFGQLSSVTSPSNLGTNLFVNSTNGDVLFAINANNVTNAFTYNSRRQLVQSIGPTNRTTKIIYDPVGNVATNIDALNHSTTYTWSPTRHLLTTTLPATSQGTPSITNIYDNRDWLIKTLDPLQLPTTNAYDLAGRTLSVTDPMLRTTQLTYDNDGRNITITNAMMQGIAQSWDGRGELVRTADQLAQNISRKYDASGNLIYLTNRLNNAWTFQFDAANRLTNTISPMGATTAQVWNNRGLLQKIVDAKNQTNTLLYDARGRLTNRTDNVAATTYLYDFNGNRIGVIESGKSNVWAFDAYDRPITYVDSLGNQIKYGYDTNGNLTTLVYPGPRLVTYFYDNLNRLTNITDWASRKTTYTYDLDSRVTSVTRPNGTTCSNFYDLDGELTNTIEQAASHAPITFFKLKWNAAARVDYEFMAPTNHPYSLPSRSMSYDKDNRLATFNGLTIVNDTNGNMTSGPLVGSTNLIAYTYDARNRLTTAGSLTYGYDPNNERTAVVNAPTVTRYVVDPLGPQVLMRIQNGVTNYYVYGLGLVYEEDDTATSTNALTYHFDYRGSTIALTDVNGNVTDRIQYSAYGMTTYRAGTNDTPFLYNGKYGVQTDPNGLLFMRARYYNPYICRFINADPSGFNGGLNMYAYSDGNPISLTDPFGLGATGSSGGFSWIGALTTGAVALDQGLNGGAGTKTLANFAANYQFFDNSVPMALNQTLNPFTSAEERFGESYDGLSYQPSNVGQPLSTGSRTVSAAFGVVDTGLGVLQGVGLGSTVSSLAGLTATTSTTLTTTEAISPAVRNFLAGDIPLSDVPPAEATQAADHLENVIAPAARDEVDAAYQIARAKALKGLGPPPGQITAWRAKYRK
ncbi:MAG TPA: RHS repeat-associated core domain-containing protein [Verrucomicrobiae bacterium]|nr:RHS repeat-associated core domain-containing protein [Verrucomicrobiae bacterium]